MPRKRLSQLIISQPKTNIGAIASINVSNPSNGILVNATSGGLYQYEANSKSATGNNFSQIPYNNQDKGRWISLTNRLIVQSKIPFYARARRIQGWKSTASPLIEARFGASGCGLQNDALCTGGEFGTGNPPSITLSVEDYNGVSWGQANALIKERYFHGASGLSADALVCGGKKNITSFIDTTEIRVGKGIWKKQKVSANLPNPLAFFALSGSASDALAVAGSKPGGLSNSIIHFDGDTWSISGNINLARSNLGGGGNPYHMLISGGMSTTNSLNSSEFIQHNGTNWVVSSAPTLNIARHNHGSVGNHDYHLVFGGNSNSLYLKSTESFNGIAWTNESDLINNRISSSNSGTGTAALAATGNDETSKKLSTSESNQSFWDSFFGVEPELKQFHIIFYNNTISAWKSIANLNRNRYRHAACGTGYNALVVGGKRSQPINVTEIYNGLVWSTGGQLPKKLANLAGSGGGLDIALAGGGENRKNKTFSTIYQYNFTGNTWSAAGNLLSARNFAQATGTGTHSTFFSGQIDGTSTLQTEVFESAVSILSGNLLIATTDSGTGGNSKEKFCLAGMTGSTPSNYFQISSFCTWSTSAHNYPVSVSGLSATGQLNDILAAGGQDGSNNFPNYSCTYNGITWQHSSRPLGNRICGSGIGFSKKALFIGGSGNPDAFENYPGVEEYSAGAISILGLSLD